MLAFSGMYSLQGGEFWKIFLIDPDTRILEVVPVPKVRECTRPLWSADRQRLAFTAAKRAINGTRAVYLFDRSNGSLRKLTRDAVYLSALAWMPDGQSLVVFDAVGTTWFLSQLDLTSGKMHQLVNITDWLHYAWSPTWQHLTFIPKSDDTHIYISDIADGGQRLLSPELFPHVGDLAWSPNGEYIAFTTYENEHIYLNSINIHNAERKRFGEVAYEVQYAWSPTGSHIAYLGYGDRGFALYTVNVQDMTTVYLADVHSGDESGEIRPTNPVWSENGMEIAFSTFDTSLVFQIYRVYTNGGSLKAIMPNTPTFALIYDLA